jgi:PEP-CTERM/exosortase A-associated glycosyltransferase
MNVLHVLHTSIPYLCGYSIRSRYIINSQAAQGMKPVVVTSAQQPDIAAPCDVFDGIEHWRTPALARPLPFGLREIALMNQLRKTLEEQVQRQRPDLIHAHSPMLVGLPALQVARKFKIPFVYEVRDLWENASVDRGKFGDGSPAYRLAQALETRVLRGADATVAICESLAGALRPRVRAADSLFVVGNGVDTSQFQHHPGKAIATLPEAGGKQIISYIGTFQPYEGLETLIGAMKPIVQAVPKAHLVIVGAGGVEEALKQQVEREGLQDCVTFTGRVPHDQVNALYLSADVMVYPRILTRTTALTTPLKPLEAMAMSCAVIASDVPAMKELIDDGQTGLLFQAGDASALATRCISLLQNATERQRLGDAGRRWVVEQRDWNTLVARYQNIYQHARSVAH